MPDYVPSEEVKEAAYRAYWDSRSEGPREAIEAALTAAVPLELQRERERYQSVVAAARSLLAHSSGQLRPHADRYYWDALKHALEEAEGGES